MCIGTLPIAGCLPVDSQTVRGHDWTFDRAFVVPSYGHSSLAQAQSAIDFAKRNYPDHKLISSGSVQTGRRYAEIVVHPYVWKNANPKVVKWLHETARTRLLMGGLYFEIGK